MLQERRLAAVRELARLLKPRGRALIYVWAFEQEYNKQRSKYLKDHNKEHHGKENLTKSQEPCGISIQTSQHLEDSNEPVGKVTEGKLSVHTNRTAFNTQDLLVPWHLKEGKKQGEEESGDGGKKNKRKEKSKKVSTNQTRFDRNPQPSPGFDVSMSPGSRRDTSDATHSADSKPSPSSGTTQSLSTTLTSEADICRAPVFHRYYHVFQQGELEQLCSQVDGVSVQSSYHDQGNWCVILEKD